MDAKHGELLPDCAEAASERRSKLEAGTAGLVLFLTCAMPALMAIAV